MEKTDLIEFLKWIKGSCTPRTTSRNNIYAAYWQTKDGVLYNDEELINYWTENIKRVKN